MRLFVSCFALLLLPLLGEGAAPVPDNVQAIFRKHCAECHDAKDRKGGLELTAPGIARGGRHGPVIVPRKADVSRLWQMIAQEKMPPESPLPAADRQVLRRWIEDGAPGVTLQPSATHWAFRPLVRPSLPAVRQPERAHTPIDVFVLAELEKKGLSLAPEADRAALIRRVSFGLTGLPPTPADADDFVKDNSGDAHQRMIGRYLASPQYGERWGKYWLDVAGYADSNGYFNADSDRPLAWRYRDWVIRALNADKPYNRFVQEQLAGDELAGYASGGDVTPEMIEPLTATHFLRNAPDGSGESDGNPDEVRIDRFTALEGNVQLAMNALLGITIQCARCHDHKFEPVSQEEYYSLQAILFPAYCPDRWVKPNERVVSIGSKPEREEHQRQTDKIGQEIKALQASLTASAEAVRIKVIEARLAHLKPEVRSAVLKAAGLPKGKQSKEERELVKKHVEPLKISDGDLAKQSPEYATLLEKVRKEIAEREKSRPKALEKLAVLVDVVPNPPAHRLLIRGQHNKPGKEVQPGAVAALSSPSNTYQLASGTGRRSALARWVTSPQNPLFARVMVNRVWQHHFGVGLVSTPDNLGQSGARPSHPELLDWLASEFIESGYSLKHLHRLILHSAVYRQSSMPRKELLAADPDNRLLGRYPLRRLDAEAVRDTLLAVSGELDVRLGGPYVPSKRTPEGVIEIDETNGGARRRSLYLQQRRTQVVTFLDLFDAPAITVNCSVRNTSTVPLQALSLLNSDFARLRAAAFAQRLTREAGPQADARIRLAFRLACGREPSEAERLGTARFLEIQRKEYATEKDADGKVWADFCHMVMVSNALLYVE